MEFWMGVAMTLLVESVALIAGKQWLRKKIREAYRDKGRTQT